MRRWIASSVLVVCAAAVFAGDNSKPADPPKSLAARDAMRAFDSAKRKAQQDFDQAMHAATTKYVKDLTAAEGAASRGGKTDEVERIKAVLAELNSSTSTFTIAAEKPWQPTLHVQRGRAIKIKASGMWSAGYGSIGPAGVGGKYMLIGRIGNGDPFDIGEGTTLTPDRDGDLLMQMKDQGLKDNSGEIEVEITTSAV